MEPRGIQRRCGNCQAANPTCVSGGVKSQVPVAPSLRTGDSDATGFTLLELLVVIAVVAILAALLLPALSRTKEKSRAIMCRSNERQNGLSYALVIGNDDQRLDGPEVVVWFQGEFGRGASTWTCPDAPATDQSAPDGSPQVSGTLRSAWMSAFWPHDAGDHEEQLPDARAGSYAMNGFLTMVSLARRYPPDAQEDAYAHSVGFSTDGQIKYPARTPTFADGFLWLAFPFEGDLPAKNLVNGDYSGANPVGMSLVTMPRHGRRSNQGLTDWPSNQPLPGAVNVSFFDGHVEQVMLDNLWQLDWRNGWNAPPRRPGLP
jgi:prepilin-type N-terminal cleavage/methylation domain-containing protein/prepilin-type processing-associated H-X9-DG protein